MNAAAVDAVNAADVEGVNAAAVEGVNAAAVDGLNAAAVAESTVGVFEPELHDHEYEYHWMASRHSIPSASVCTRYVLSLFD